MIRLLASLAAAGLTSGCALAHVAAPPPAPVDPAVMLLTEAALGAETALAELSRIERSRDPATAAAMPRLVPPALLRRISLTWTGPIAPLVKGLADRAEWAFETAGEPPVRAPFLDLQVTDEPIIAILRDVGIRAGVVADVHVDAGRQIVRLEWRDA